MHLALFFSCKLQFSISYLKKQVLNTYFTGVSFKSARTWTCEVVSRSWTVTSILTWKWGAWIHSWRKKDDLLFWLEFSDIDYGLKVILQRAIKSEWISHFLTMKNTCPFSLTLTSCDESFNWWRLYWMHLIVVG